MEKGGGSRLLQMQARFQQRQLQEREMKIASLYEAQQARALDRVRHSPINGVAAVTSPPQPQPTPQPGKVRQMFEERRTKAGIDKSYPLQPIHNTDRTARKALPNGYTKVSNSSSNVKVSVEKRTTKTHASVSTHSIKKQLQVNNIQKIVNGAGDVNHNHESDLNSVEYTPPHTNGAVTPSIDEADNYLLQNVTDKCNNDLLENETFPESLEPMPTPRTPEPVVVARPRSPEPPAQRQPTPTNHPPRRNSPVKTSPGSTKPQKTAVTPTRRGPSENVVSESSKARGVMQKTTTPKASSNSAALGLSKTRGRTAAANSTATSASPAPTTNGGGGSAATCGICGRHFVPDRVAKHQEICKKAHAKKRKPFDVLKHRLAGTEAEPFINKLRKNTTTPSATKVNKALNNNWRQKHEEFIQAIRAAKQVQAHLNAGGKLSDLPPPPPSENPDYVQCPHCGRRFNQGAAERHIPKCASYQFNKPKGNKTVKRR